MNTHVHFSPTRRTRILSRQLPCSSRKYVMTMFTACISMWHLDAAPSCRQIRCVLCYSVGLRCSSTGERSHWLGRKTDKGSCPWGLWHDGDNMCDQLHNPRQFEERYSWKAPPEYVGQARQRRTFCQRAKYHERLSAQSCGECGNIHDGWLDENRWYLSVWWRRWHIRCRSRQGGKLWTARLNWMKMHLIYITYLAHQIQRISGENIDFFSTSVDADELHIAMQVPPAGYSSPVRSSCTASWPF